MGHGALVMRLASVLFKLRHTVWDGKFRVDASERREDPDADAYKRKQHHGVGHVPVLLGRSYL